MAALTLRVLTTKTTHVLRLHYTTLHYTALHYTALHCTTLHDTTLHCTILYYTTVALHFTMAIHVYAFLQLVHNFKQLHQCYKKRQRGCVSYIVVYKVGYSIHWSTGLRFQYQAGQTLWSSACHVPAERPSPTLLASSVELVYSCGK